MTHSAIGQIEEDLFCGENSGRGLRRIAKSFFDVACRGSTRKVREPDTDRVVRSGGFDNGNGVRHDSPSIHFFFFAGCFFAASAGLAGSGSGILISVTTWI